jgi:hypothetical protein
MELKEKSSETNTKVGNETEAIKNVIVKEDGKWFVRSEAGKNLGGPYSTKQAAEERLKEVEMFKHMKKNQLVTMKSSVSPVSIRNDNMEGKDWLVVPMVMLVEGVHNGSCGALLYPEEELEKTPVVWNHKPVVVYHPSGPTACDPDVLTNRKIGVIMNTTYEEGKLKAEAWLDPERIEKVDKRIAEAIENKEMMELSTGLFTDLDGCVGEWGDEQYDSIATNYRPDHLALLPDMTGACSMKDGAGFFRLNSENTEKSGDDENKISETWAKSYFEVLEAAGIDTKKLVSNELSHSAIWSQLNDKVQKKNSRAWLEEVFNTFCVYNIDGALFLQSYEVAKDNIVSLSGTAQPVVRVVQYKTKSGKSLEINDSKENIMNKEELIKKLLENKDSGWTAEDQEVLDSMDEAMLDAIATKVENRVTEKVEEKPVEMKEEKPVVNEEPKEPEKIMNKEEEKPKELTEEEYIAAAPKNIRNVLTRGLSAYNSEKEKLIAIIKKNKHNAFNDEYLQARELDELLGLAKLAAPEQKAMDNDTILMADYSGQAEIAATENSDVDVLELPVPTFEATA